MLPRPHILQPTDRRTFVQGLRIIEGIQDFFLVVVRPAGQDKLKVDAHLQTGHFPENVQIADVVSEVDQYDTRTEFVGPFTKKCLGLGLVEGAVGSVLDGLGGEPPYIRTSVTRGPQIFDGFETDGWEFDTSEGDSGHKAIIEHRLDDDNLASFKGISFHVHQYKREPPDKVSIDIAVDNQNIWPSAGSGDAIFSRKYEVFLRRKKGGNVGKAADIAGLLITQRSLCVQIAFGECIRKIPFRDFFGDVGIVNEVPFNLDDLYDIPVSINVGKISDIDPRGPRFDFAFKKGILRKLQRAMVTAGSSSLFRYQSGGIGYLQTRHFQMRLLKILPAATLDRPLNEISFVSDEVKERVDMSLREFLTISDTQTAAKLGVSLREARELKSKLLPRRDSRA
jgi:hypothetical protein